MLSGIMVSGYEADFVSFKAPSGQWSVDLDAYLTSMSASFGFNNSPHKFSLQFVPSAYNGASGQLPEIGTYTTYEVRQGSCSQGFLIAGNVVHADYQNSTAGTAMKVEIEDRRNEILGVLKITTEDLGTDIPNGVVSVGEAYRLQTGFTDINGDIEDARVKEYRNITELGATYQQIYEAIIYASGAGRSAFDWTKLPHPSVVSSNTLGSLEPLRFKFSAIPLSQVVSTVLSDSAFDWYWGMNDDEVKIVNRKVTFNVTEDSLAVQKLTPDSPTFGFGTDVVQSPSKVTILGAHQEGFLNSTLLGGIDGIDSPAGASFTFTPAWDSINVSFWDAYGAYRSYAPTETELKCALKGIEHWTYYKLYQNAGAPLGWSDGVDAGTSGALHHTFQSRYDTMMPVSDFTNNSESGIRIITNRIDTEHNWVLEWYAKIQNHANSHYGRTYALSGIAFNENEGEYKVIQAAWCNLENQRAEPGEPYGENYEIHNQYAALAPFITQDFKIQAHCVLPSSTLYGPEGLSAPASFADWNEEAHPSGTQSYDHYIPVSLKRVGQNVINPRAPGNAFEDYPEGTIIAQLPVLAGTGLLTSAQLSTVVTTFEQAAAAQQSGIADALNPHTLIGVHETLTGVAIPVQVRSRYGQIYPTAWSSGTGSGTRDELIISDSYAPWNYFPIGNNSSVDVMSGRVSGVMSAKLIEVSESRYADITKVDWPIVSFDGFANQNAISGVYGTRDHGITTVSVNVNNGVPQTKYSIKSYFSEFGKDAPLGERNAAILNGLIHPIDYTEFQVSNPQRPAPIVFNYGLPTPSFNAAISPNKYVYAVTITQVLNRGSATDPERYHSVTKDNVPKPGGAVDPLDSLDLICRDGFLNVDDHALYVVEYKSDGRRRRYYTGGTDLTTGAFVVSVDTVNAADVDVTYRGFSLPTVPVLPGIDIDTITAGDTGKLVSDGVQRPQNEGNITGIRPAITCESKGIYFEPAATGTAGGGSGEAAIITAIANLGESGALASVQKVFPSGVNAQAGPSGAVTGTVYPLPWAAFAQSGDVGVFVNNGADNFIFISRAGFSNFDIL